MNESTLYICTNKMEHVYTGKDADKIFKSIDDAGINGIEWSCCKIDSGLEIIFVLANICSIGYKRGMEG